MMGFGLLLPIIVVIALAYAFGWLPNQDDRAPRRNQTGYHPTALELLEERYARGEISRDEYLDMRDDLRR